MAVTRLLSYDGMGSFSLRFCGDVPGLVIEVEGIEFEITFVSANLLHDFREAMLDTLNRATTYAHLMGQVRALETQKRGESK